MSTYLLYSEIESIDL